MPVAAVILVEPSQAGNLGAVVRVAANFGVPRLELVRPAVDLSDPEVRRWACGAESRLRTRTWANLAEAAAPYRALVASASARGRENLPVLDPRTALQLLVERGLQQTALVFGNETRGLSRDDIDRCDLVVRVPTVEEFPVLNLAQAVAILLAECAGSNGDRSECGIDPAPQEALEGLMGHLEQSLLTIGFLDPHNPQRILRKLRRLFGRAGLTEDEVRILRGVCRQMEWAAEVKPGRFGRPGSDSA
jgi:tRNA/rRNA methyltransferase